MKPAHGLAAIHGLRIGQPEGFGDGLVIELARVMAEIDMGSLGSEEGILIRMVEVQGLTASIAKDGEGVLNLLRLGPPPPRGRRRGGRRRFIGWGKWKEGSGLDIQY